MKRVLAKMDKLQQTGSSSNFLLDPKWLSLAGFILQNTLLIIGLKACIINSSHSMSSYIASTAVILAEILKFILSTLACFFIDCKGNYTLFKEVIYTVLMEEGADVMKLCVPAILYTIQNNLQYVIEEAPLFLVLYQAKIITTALFYSTMLNRRMNSKEWMCIVALTLGVGMVESSQMEIVPNHVGKIAGVVAVIFACLTSGVAGVYFEKILKSSRSSIWVINMQMSLLSAFFCTSVALTQDSLEIARHGVFTGYNPLVLLSIVLQALTGLAVALVVKYADNLYKGFGHSFSLVICSSISSILFDDTAVNEAFLMGSFLVVASSVAFSSVAQAGPVHSNTTTNTLNAYARTGNTSTINSSSAVPSRPLAADYVYIDNLRSNIDMDVESALHRAEGGNNITIDTIIPNNSVIGLTSGSKDTSPDSEAESLLSVDHNTALLLALEKGPIHSATASNSIGGAGVNMKATVSENNSSAGGGGIGWLKGVW
eukprot:CAMPEP_0185002984 /NCGR_PEP_ID=MMETSP1098-20130426/75268_1 /TAXON_ID=89044 /ORGANISM="Spumella elongata, Strain CCAP 955/1" /LENGTH=485 /DNA_ID=CAMNT_0027530573 /DNA_START=55 /DNA_END=1509 /DNA_ORIENTATION=-